ncbi:MAG: tRNA 2-thiocytidine biosynthesis TtcA family protein [Clostridiaceae bacterium]|nr:tRNA 2-thiocytidine biosynthesis TtcA family protein [Clostridiaceae bacterium]MBW4859006.1 tRNA 2-thiocytidine biosynthesis TtcA family protein [Clostridiaceae bacterium]MBW4869581.1 tRNA 2-thiocytidine biosynthesis TtcA family protein [Clostridiaceae bacterium]
MKKWYNKFFLNNIRMAVENYNMIESRDKILVGLSGGKDSIFLLYSLMLLRENSYLNFDIIGLHIDIGLRVDMESTKNFLVENNILYIYENIDIIDKIFEDKKSPCYLCSKMKRGAIARIAKEVGTNKIALGHHKTDLVITFLLNLIYTGKLDTFKPISYNEKHDLHLIRPLIYVEEDIIEKIVNDENLPLGKGECPQDVKNKRSEIGNLVKYIENKYPDFEQKTITAIENFSDDNLW